MNSIFIESWNLLEAINEESDLFHGSYVADIEKFNTPIIWLTPSQLYAKHFATANRDKGCIYKCKLNTENNLFEVGITNSPIYSINPTSTAFSPTFKDIIKRLDLSDEEVETLITKSAEEFDYTKNDFGRYSRGAKALPLFNLCRTNYFKELLSKRGYTGIKAKEFDTFTNNYHDTIGVFNPNAVSILDKSIVAA